MTQQQFDKLDKGVYVKYSLEDECIEETVDARKLLCTSRFDFYGVLLYIDHRVKGLKDISFAQEVYRERTRAMTGDRFAENGNPQKCDFESYVRTLDALIDDFKADRFDAERTYIPVDRDYTPLDGAHRVCCAAYFSKKLKILRFPGLEYQFKGYQYLRHELLPVRYSDILALESARWHDDLYVFFLWPQGHLDSGKLQQAQQMIYDSTDVMYDVEYKLSYGAIRNLMLQIYGHMDWIGTIDNDFANIFMKVDEVWAANGLVRLIIVRGKSCEFITHLKTRIREMYGIGLSSCHSTDNIRETRLALDALLNEQSRHFLENAKPTTFHESYRLANRFHQLLDANNLSPDHFIIDSSMVLAVYGAREARDLDFYCIPGTDLTAFASEPNIEEHDDTQKVYYSLPVTDYINNVSHHFVFNGLKFMSLANLRQFKEARYAKTHEIKDAHDLELIEALGTGVTPLQRWKREAIYALKRRWRKIYDYFYALIFWRRREILEKIGLYKPLKWFKTNILHK